MKLLLCSIALSFSLLANGAAVHPDTVPPNEALRFFVDKNQNFCLGAESNTDGAAVLAVPCSGSSNIVWTVPNGGPGTGVITMFGDKCLDVPSGVNKDGTKLQIFSCSNNGNRNQQWTISNDLTIKWAGTNKCLDNTGGALLAGGNPTQIWTCGNNNLNQKWLPDSFDPVGIAPGGTAFILIPRADGTVGCLAASGGVAGSSVIYEDCNTSDPSQQWVLSGGTPPSTENIIGQTGTISVFGNLCLDVPNGAPGNGVKLQVFTCGAGNPNQQWNANGDGTIKWHGTNKCVDLTNGVKTNGNPVQTFGCSAGNINQEWFFSG